MKDVVILSFTNSASDPRVLRQVQAIGTVANVTVYGYGGRSDSIANFVPLALDSPQVAYPLTKKLVDGFLLLIGDFDRYFWRRPEMQIASLREVRRDADIYIAHDFEAAVFLLSIVSRDSKVFIDAREFTPDEIPRGKWYRYLLQRYRTDWLVGGHIKLVAGVMTVSERIAQAYEEIFLINRPIVIMNVPGYQELAPTKTQASTIRLVHHGIASRPRKLEALIEIVEALDERFELNFMLLPSASDPAYLAELQEACSVSSRSRSIRFHPPVPTEQIANFINQFDIGVFLHFPDTLNAEFALPNKFFEFIQGRLSIAIGPSVEMARIVEDYELGVISESFDSQALAECINALSIETIDNFKANASRAAEVYNWENDRGGLMTLLGVQD